MCFYKILRHIFKSTSISTWSDFAQKPRSSICIWILLDKFSTREYYRTCPKSGMPPIMSVRNCRSYVHVWWSNFEKYITEKYKVLNFVQHRQTVSTLSVSQRIPSFYCKRPPPLSKGISWTTQQTPWMNLPCPPLLWDHSYLRGQQTHGCTLQSIPACIPAQTCHLRGSHRL